MRPRPFGPGYIATINLKCRIFISFNEAQAFRPRIPYLSRRWKYAARRFNEAQAFRPRIQRKIMHGSAEYRIRFNEAQAFRPRIL